MKTLKNLLWPLLFLLLTLVVWEGMVRFYAVARWLLPAPSQVLQTLWQSRALLAEHTGQTLLEAGAGLLLAVAAALLLAWLMDFSAALRRALYPLLVVSQTIPIISIAPLFIIWFGYEMLPKVIVVALVCFFPVVVSVVEAMAGVDREMINLMRVMGARRGQIFTKVKLPAALPSFFSGLKISAAYSIMGAVIGEWLGASKGLGVYMTRATRSYQTDGVLAAVVIISVLSLGVFVLIELLARMIMPWHKEGRK
ncbi:ABC transporter permease [Desulforamulus ruminis]|uniref:Binding-protein-dependent transport systems inner membrane component n=1 Tax=Desulforamulus ruminis (strain ATCC 23193 / DSM 2154 / NCIMB 8452 / DL) TaxID=696281 RepID=F6DLY6_DESRL|nr:ABC transporter permease [Desulforamulus ruminis]AEG58429.1 binding-protein-dependent transport systems inner membrane component [Desulforamulus ruminis DSM 2154]